MATLLPSMTICRSFGVCKPCGSLLHALFDWASSPSESPCNLWPHCAPSLINSYDRKKLQHLIYTRHAKCKKKKSERASGTRVCLSATPYSPPPSLPDSFIGIGRSSGPKPKSPFDSSAHVSYNTSPLTVSVLLVIASTTVRKTTRPVARFPNRPRKNVLTKYARLVLYYLL